MNKRDYLVSKGLAKPGRGKFSNAAKEALVKAESEGMRFSDSTTGAPVVKSDKAPEVKKDGDSPYLSPDDFRFPEKEYLARDADGKTYSMRECCNTCRVSLTNHMCNTPTIHNFITVSIEERR